MQVTPGLANKVLVYTTTLSILGPIFIFIWMGNAHERITTKITFDKEIVRIFARSCLSCHHPGGIAPMPLTTYAEARPWAKAIKEEVVERRMPPWHAVPGYGEFANDPSLSSRDLDLITAWVDGGSPKGDDKDLPPIPDFETEWPLGKPDLVLTPSGAHSVRAEGEDECRCFSIPAGSTVDRWVKAVDLRPGDRSVVHHAFLWLDKSGRAEQLEAEDRIPGYDCFGGPRFVPSGNLGGWVPGQRPIALPRGIAALLPAGSSLVLQVHYHNSGIETRDLTKLGIYFSREPVKRRLRSLAIVNTKFEIPPGESLYRVKASVTFEKDAEAVSILPHMHLLGKSMEVTALRPDGTREVLVWVRNYDFNWPTTYVLKRPVSLPRGTRLEVTAYYDNSGDNPRNPNSPPKPVRYGESANSEMCAAYLMYTLKGERLTANHH